MDISKLPFNQLLGLQIIHEGDAPKVALSPVAAHANHVETLHATVVYGVAEAASGLCLLTQFPQFELDHVCVLRSAEVTYRRPGLADDDKRCRTDSRVLVRFPHTFSRLGE